MAIDTPFPQAYQLDGEKGRYPTTIPTPPGVFGNETASGVHDRADAMQDSGVTEVGEVHDTIRPSADATDENQVSEVLEAVRLQIADSPKFDGLLAAADDHELTAVNIDLTVDPDDTDELEKVD